MIMSSLKRPLAVLGLSMFLTVLCAVSFGNTALVVAMTALGAVITVTFMMVKTRHSHTLVTFGIGVVSACVLFLNTQYHHDLTISMCGENRNVNAVITSTPYFSLDNSRFYAEARLKSIDSQKAYGKIRLSFSRSKDEIEPDALRIGDEISFNGLVYKIGSDSDAVHNSFTSSGVYVGSYSIKELTVKSPDTRPLTYYTDLLKRWITGKINFTFDSKTSGLIIGILTGDKNYCADEVYKNFRLSGSAHILAVSGLHMSIWISVFGALFEGIKKRGKITYLIILLFVALTAFVADFSPSVCRAALMSSLFLIGRMLNADDDSLNSLGFAMVCLLCVNVYMIHSAAFQLTFICMLSIIAVSRPLCKSFSTFLNEKVKIHEAFKTLIYTAFSCMLISVTISVFTFPVCAWHFGYISLLSPITNLLLIPICAPLMVLSLLFLILSFIPGVSDIVAFAVEALCRYAVKVTEIIASSSVASVSTGEYEIITWLIVVAVLCFIFILYRLAHRHFARFVTGLLSLFIVFSFFASVGRRLEDYTIRLIGNGEEVTAVLIYNGLSVVIGVYDRYYFTQEAYLITEGENTDTVAVLPPDNTDGRYLEYLCADLDAENIIFNRESVVLYDKIKITNKGNYALIEGNGKSVAVIYEDSLQPKEYCDIIIAKDSVILQYKNEAYFDENLRYGTVTVNGKGDVRVRGERFWQNLTKKSLNPT